MKFIRPFDFVICLFISQSISSQSKISGIDANVAMMRATRFMVEKVSNNDGYVAYYLPDMSRRRGELEG